MQRDRLPRRHHAKVGSLSPSGARVPLGSPRAGRRCAAAPQKPRSRARWIGKGAHRGRAFAGFGQAQLGFESTQAQGRGSR